MGTGCGSAYSMQFLDDRLYIVTTEGMLTCIRRERHCHPGGAGRGAAPGTATSRRRRPDRWCKPGVLETVQAGAAGVVLECYREGNQLRILAVASAGYRHDWHVQFPRELRQDGVRYW